MKKIIAYLKRRYRRYQRNNEYFMLNVDMSCSYISMEDYIERKLEIDEKYKDLN